MGTIWAQRWSRRLSHRTSTASDPGRDPVGRVYAPAVWTGTQMIELGERYQLDPPDADYSGYNFWLTKLNQFNGDYIAAEMVKAFISSSEYRQRFGL